jgi:methylenetetrahydrofolate dehydrogenase (NADP+)/methenyltetrahydrofolate cyclohydrolase
MAQILDGRLVSNLLIDEVKTEIDQIAKGGMHPKLVIILVGEDPASLSYIKQKRKAADRAGLLYQQINYPTDVTEAEILHKIEELNQDLDTHGILVQLPLPDHIDIPKVLKAISPRKDVDGFHAYNVGKMFLSSEFENLVSCTPKGIIRMLDHYDIDVKGMDVTVIGHSNIVGKPMAVMLMNRNATVTVCHIDTKDLKANTLRSDVVISATGVAGLVKADMIKEGAVVIDVGCTKGADGKLCGDVDFDAVEKKASYITPVPGGVGPMTVACLIENTLEAYKWLQEHNFEATNIK